MIDRGSRVPPYQQLAGLLDIGQENLAARMRALGYNAWIRQTVGSTERGRRRPTAEEIAGLALALQTTIGKLMQPVDEDQAVELQSGGPAVSVMSVRLSVVGRSIAGEVEWDGDKPVITQPDYPPAMHDMVNRMAEGRWPPRDGES
jgi:transcriptional regulator with XRE-family HTH domain